MYNSNLEGIKDLMETRIRLQNKLEEVKNAIKINEERIKQKQRKCTHVGVALDSSRTLWDHPQFDCVICGGRDVYALCRDINEYETKRKIYAIEYLKSKYNGPEERKDKFQILQTLTLELIRENPSITEDELAIELKKIVDRDIETIESYQKMKYIERCLECYPEQSKDKNNKELLKKRTE